MLRPLLEADPSEASLYKVASWRLSAGSASVLGLCPIALDVAPTTAYVMLGDRCVADCAFCSQARSSKAPPDALSRVRWPLYVAAEVVAAMVRATEQGQLKRVCFQVTASPDDQDIARTAISMVRDATDLPVCVSLAAQNMEQISMLLAAGAERVTIALDAASPKVYERVKGGDWEQRWRLLETAAKLFPGHLGTHLIVGLGETEDELLRTAQALHRMQITIGLFAFTPIQGTRLAEHCAPDLASYRRVQAGLYLIREDLTTVDEWQFSPEGRVRDYGVSDQALRTLLKTGDAFRTAGCPDCNRPYYNERPSGPMCNYPRALTEQEIEKELDRLLASLD